MAAHLLYVDDDPNARFIVRDQLELEGYTVETAEDGDTGIEMMSKGIYDLVLLDVRMPGKSGLEVLTIMRERDIRTRAIMLTGIEEVSIAINAMKLGASDYITKPYEIDALLSCIKRALAR
jgi:two-component system nitrogen regulation response regulator NtrX